MRKVFFMIYIYYNWDYIGKIHDINESKEKQTKYQDVKTWMI